jgi:hypothetical protein
LALVERGQLLPTEILELETKATPAAPRKSITTQLVESDSDGDNDDNADESDDNDADSSINVRGWQQTKPIEWTPAQAAQWVFSLGPRFAVYAPLFSANRVTGTVLLGINEENLLNIGVANFRDRRELKTQAQRLRTVTDHGTIPR